jgi:hypothetical protein
VSSHDAPTTGGLRSVVIGRDLLPAGRVVRILAGLLLVLAALSAVPRLGGLTQALLGEIALAFVVTTAAYTILAWVLGDRLLARVDPWLAAITLVAPATLLLFFLPLSATVGYNLYIGVSLLVQAAIRYGGCEILGIPTLFLRRRYTVYCVFNAADVVERRWRGRARWAAWTLALLTLLVTMALLALAVIAGGDNGERVLYLLFLVVGFGVNRLLAAGAGARPGP